jgi:GDPmannose 4,6-dehydratase
LTKVLITGGLGQDGVILSKIYLKKKYNVFVLIKKKSKNLFLKKVIYKINDLSKKDKITKDLRIIKPSIIIHLASHNNSYIKRNNKDSYRVNYYQNFRNTKNLLDSIIDLKLKIKFIFAGSSLMYPDFSKKIISEKDIFKSNDYYGRYKIDSHKYIMSLKNKYNLNATTAILFNHDSMFRNKKFLIPRLVGAFKRKDISYIESIYKLNISGDFSHAEDICNGIYKLSTFKKNIDKIILSSGKRLFINDVINYLERLYNVKINKKISRNSIGCKTIGSNLFAKKIINYKIKKDIFLVCDEIISSYS